MSRYAAVHESPKGAEDARPTATQVVHDEGLVDKLAGKTILITGGSSGLGTDTAKALYETGAKVYITSRQMEKAGDLVKSININSSRPPVSVIEMSLDKLDSVKSGAEQFLKESGGKCDILICNAGVMASPEGRTQDGYETQFGTNHVAHFQLFQLLKPALIASSTPESPSRVVTVSSSGHRMHGIVPDNYNLEGIYNPWMAYGQSKTANVYMANEIDRRYKQQGIRAFSLHPGAIMATELSRHSMDDKLLRDSIFGDPQFEKMTKSSPQGAATQVWAAIGKDLNGKGGLYLDDVQIAGPVKEGAQPFMPGYAPHAYDEEMAKRLWADSCKFVGVKDED